jgi:hypothetical protein
MAPPLFRNHNNTSANFDFPGCPKPWKKFGPIVMVVSKISHQQKSSHFFQAIPNFRFPCHQLLVYNTPQKSSPHNDMKLANPFFLFREHYPYPLRGGKIIIPKED